MAALVCDGSFLPARIEAGGVRTELGLLSIEAGGTRGEEVDVLVRQDALVLEPDESGSAVVVGRAFPGPDDLLRVRLSSGAELRCRHGDVRLEVGWRVRATFRAEAAPSACVYAARSSLSCGASSRF